MTIETTNEKKEPEIIYDAIPWSAADLKTGENHALNVNSSSSPTTGNNDAGTPTTNAGPPIPAGHERFYCSQCNAHYDLPNRATSWRCQNCHHFNSIAPGECESCTIL